MTTITLDINHRCHLGFFLDTLEDIQGVLIEFIAKGPIQGNPRVTLGFKNQADADVFARIIRDFG